MSKKIKTCEAQLCCKATAALKKETAEELKKEDKPLQELLDEKEPESSE